MVLPDDHIKNICALGQGRSTCSFLMLDGAGFECAKGTGIDNIIAERRILGQMVAMGDNCSGPPDFVPTKNPIN